MYVTSANQIISWNAKNYLLAIAERQRRSTQQGLERGRDQRREKMKTMMLAAAATLTLGLGSAFANDGGYGGPTQFTEIPGVLAQAPAQNVPSVATAQNGQGVKVYVTHANQGTYLFAPHETGGGNG
jgi:hypothetical protein